MFKKLIRVLVVMVVVLILAASVAPQPVQAGLACLYLPDAINPNAEPVFNPCPAQQSCYLGFANSGQAFGSCGPAGKPGEIVITVNP